MQTYKVVSLKNGRVAKVESDKMYSRQQLDDERVTEKQIDDYFTKTIIKIFITSRQKKIPVGKILIVPYKYYFVRNDVSSGDLYIANGKSDDNGLIFYSILSFEFKCIGVDIDSLLENSSESLKKSFIVKYNVNFEKYGYESIIDFDKTYGVDFYYKMGLKKLENIYGQALEEYLRIKKTHPNDLTCSSDTTFPEIQTSDDKLDAKIKELIGRLIEVAEELKKLYAEADKSTAVSAQDGLTSQYSQNEKWRNITYEVTNLAKKEGFNAGK